MTVIYITIPETEPIAIAIYGFVIRKDEINTGIDAIKTIIKIDNVSMSWFCIVNGIIFEEKYILKPKEINDEIIDPTQTVYKPNGIDTVKIDIPTTFFIISNFKNVEVSPLTW